MSIYRYDLQNIQIRLTHFDARLLYVSQEKFAGDWHGIEHTHSCSELFYVLEGNGFFSIENKIYSVAANDFVVINANILHTEIGNPSTPMKYIVLGVEGLELSTQKEEENYHHYIVSFKKIREQVMFLMQNLMTEIDRKNCGFEKICQHYMDILILLLARQTSFYAPLSPTRLVSTRLAPLVRRHIDDHYREPITLDILSDVSHADKYHIVHTFTEEYGVSPIHYLISRRIEEAEKLLATTDYSLSVISRFCGFSSPSYFSQVFKRRHNCSPREYRKKSRVSGQGVPDDTLPG